MSYFNRLSFASGYYHISKGIITISDDMPHDMKIRFWKTWRDWRQEIIEQEKLGRFSSARPTIPIEDEDPNLWQYEELLKNEQD